MALQNLEGEISLTLLLRLQSATGHELCLRALLSSMLDRVFKGEL